jgi:hypothetical protein
MYYWLLECGIVVNESEDRWKYLMKYPEGINEV